MVRRAPASQKSDSESSQGVTSIFWGAAAPSISKGSTAATFCCLAVRLSGSSVAFLFPVTAAAFQGATGRLVPQDVVKA